MQGQRRLTRRVGAAVVSAAMVAGGVSAGLVASGSTLRHHRAAPRVHRGGSLTVLEGPTQAMNGLDPGHETLLTYKGVLDAIYGELFEVGQNGKEIPDLASGYSYARGGKTLVIHLRKGVRFTDGTAFDAAAVKFNFERDLKETCADCKPSFPITSITTPNSETVDVNMPKVFAPILAAFQADSFNFVVSPTALKKEGESAFSRAPVGAGPFTVQSYEYGSVLTLKRNPHYWQKGHPYLDALTFKSVANDETAYEALLAGNAGAYEDMNTVSLVKAFRQHFTVTEEPSTAPEVILFNALKPPFNRLKAREAMFYATDVPLIDQKLFGGAFPVTESFLAPGGLFYEKKVPGYRSYDPAKAKALVKQLGGLTVRLAFYEGSLSQHLSEALQAEWQAAGIKVNLESLDLTRDIQVSESGTWQAENTATGSFDPGVSGGIPLFFLPTDPQAGEHDAHLAALMAAAGTTTSATARAKLYHELASYIDAKAYGLFLFPVDVFQVAAKGVSGPGLTTKLPSVITTEVLWQDVSVAKVSQS